jgi:lipoyl(octanoyl) transferase
MPNIIIRNLGLCDYAAIWEQMQQFTTARTATTPDEIWLLEHPPVFTQGLAGKPEHVLNPGDIPIVQTDRGGQITYHGPGQLVGYVLFDLKRAKIGVKQFVHLLETAAINLLADYKISAHSDPHAPGVYVDKSKICSIGLRIRRGCSYHGIALNVNNDLEPFTRINPCGFRNLHMTNIKILTNSAHDLDLAEMGKKFVNALQLVNISKASAG